ncbi:MAG: sensor histidine kinase [Leptospiraceae bacterium]|nr:sensor histidine kinase [Leptospiraceae bacterium]
MRIILFSTILIGVIHCIPQEKKNPPKVIAGTLDLEGWDFKKDGIVKLDGEWEFYWNEFLNPGEIRTDVKYILVPGKWNEHLFNDKEIGYAGYATYRIKIKNADFKNTGMKIHQIFSNYDFYLNGKLVAMSGKTGKTKESSGFDYFKKNIPIDDFKGDVEILIHVSNFLHARGGLRDSNLLGAREDLAKIRDRTLYFDFFLLGSLLIMALYHIGLFLLRREDRSVLYFAMFCLLLAVRPLFVREGMQSLISELNFSLILKLEYIDLFLSPTFILLFLQSNFREEFNTRITQVFILLFFALILVVLFFPMRIYTLTITTFEFFLLCVFAYILYCILKAIYKKREGSIIIFIGLLVIMVFSVNDILFEKGIIQTGYFASLGVFLFIFSQAYMLSMKFSNAFTQSEVSRNYAEEQKQLAENRKVEIEKLNKAKDEFLANLSHELRTPLTYIYMYSEILSSSFDETLAITYGKELFANAQKLNEYLDDLILLTDIESNLELYLEEIDLKSIFEEEIRKVTSLASTKNITINNTISENLTLKGDKRLLEKTVQTILKNSILYNNPNGHSLITGKVEFGQIRFSVKDTGIGIADEHKEKVFEKFFRVDSSLTYEVQGLGVGLYLAKKIVELHKGEMKLVSEYGNGSEFIITLPAIDGRLV